LQDFFLSTLKIFKQTNEQKNKTITLIGWNHPFFLTVMSSKSSEDFSLLLLLNTTNKTIVFVGFVICAEFIRKNALIGWKFIYKNPNSIEKNQEKSLQNQTTKFHPLKTTLKILKKPLKLHQKPPKPFKDTKNLNKTPQQNFKHLSNTQNS